MWLEHLRQDARYALRSFARSPLFTCTAVLSLAIGIGADTAVFSVANALLLRSPSGVNEPDRLVDISVAEGGSFGIDEVSFPNYLDIRLQASTIVDVYGYAPFPAPMSVSVSDGAERVFGHKVTTNYFDVLGVGAAAGRLFDTNPGRRAEAEQTVVLSHRYWTTRFQGNPEIVGRPIGVNGSLLTVVGVAARNFAGTSLVATDIWTPLTTIATPASYLSQRGLGWALLRGRLKPGLSVSEAAAEFQTIGRHLEEQYPEANSAKSLRLASASFIPGNLALPFAGIATLVLGFVSLVLIIACANLAGLLLTRTTARRREIAVRIAIGAGRGRLVRQLSTETAILFLFGALASLVVARVFTALIVLVVPSLPVPLEVSLDLDGRTLAFTSVVALVAALFCGLVPALDASKADVADTLKNGGEAASGRSRWRHAFVVSQVALSVVLVAGAGIFARALQKAASIDPGFEIFGIELGDVDLSLAGYTTASGTRFLSDLSARVRAIPGVEDAAIAATLPTSGPARFGRLSHPGDDPVRGGRTLPADWNLVEPRYFSTLRIPLIAGRDFTDADSPEGAQAIIVSDEAARRYWPGQDPIGKALSSSSVRASARPGQRAEDADGGGHCGEREEPTAGRHATPGVSPAAATIRAAHHHRRSHGERSADACSHSSRSGVAGPQPAGGLAIARRGGPVCAAAAADCRNRLGRAGPRRPAARGDGHLRCHGLRGRAPRSRVRHSHGARRDAGRGHRHGAPPRDDAGRCRSRNRTLAGYRCGRRAHEHLVWLPANRHGRSGRRGGTAHADWCRGMPRPGPPSNGGQPGGRASC